MAVRLPLDELEGARPDELGHLGRRRVLLGDLLRIDGGEVVGVGQGDQDDARLLLEPQLDRVLSDRAHVLDRGPQRLGLGGIPAPALEGGDDVLAGELLAVVELDSLPELDRVHEAIGGSRRHPVGEVGDRLVGLVEGVQALVHVLSDDLDEVGRRPVRVERGRIPEHGHPDDAAPLRRLGLGEGTKGRQATTRAHEDGVPEEHERSGGTGRCS